jgi:hypothetical protein
LVSCPQFVVDVLCPAGDVLCTREDFIQTDQAGAALQYACDSLASCFYFTVNGAAWLSALYSSVVGTFLFGCRHFTLRLLHAAARAPIHVM